MEMLIHAAECPTARQKQQDRLIQFLVIAVVVIGIIAQAFSSDHDSIRRRLPRLLHLTAATFPTSSC